jgi:hypothetical protein
MRVSGKGFLATASAARLDVKSRVYFVIFLLTDSRDEDFATK